jgi:hypothetical protein
VLAQFPDYDTVCIDRNGEFVPSPNKMDTVIVAFREIGVNALQENRRYGWKEAGDGADGARR